MTDNAELRRELVATLNLYMRQRDATTDEATLATIEDGIEITRGQLQDVNQADLLTAARMCTSAADKLDEVARSARLGAFGGFARMAEEQAAKLRALVAKPRATASKRAAAKPPTRGSAPAPRPAARKAMKKPARKAAAKKTTKKAKKKR